MRLCGCIGLLCCSGLAVQAAGVVDDSTQTIGEQIITAVPTADSTTAHRHDTEDTSVTFPTVSADDSGDTPSHLPLFSFHGLTHRLGMNVGAGTVFPMQRFFHGANAQGRMVVPTFTTHLEYAFQFAPDTYWGNLYPYAMQGVGVSYHTFFDKAEMGMPVAVYAFQRSRIASLTRTLSVDYEWNFGASFGWKPYDMVTNVNNEVVGSRTNAYINLGCMLSWQFSPQWNLSAGIDFTHFSNGNTSYPNAGVNTWGARVGMMRTLNNPSAGQDAPRRTTFKPHMTYDVVLYGALKKRGFFLPDVENPYIVPGMFAVGGLNVNPMYNLHPAFRLGASLDVQYDESANIKDHIVNKQVEAADMKFYRPPLMEQLSIGLSARAEVVMPIFSINLGIGYNVLGRGEDLQGFYQVFVLKTHLTRSLYLHVGYQAFRFQDPNHLMLGIGYRFGDR